MSESEPLTTAVALAREIGVCNRTINRWAKAGKIPAVRLSPRIQRFRRRAVLVALGMEQAAEGGRNAN